VSELSDRRARKKAQTREAIRSVAHRMFAEQGFESVTIADIAREADVAVQTVFNHFPTKEDLFFEGRAAWVGGAARAVREREAHVPALTALREHLIESVRDYMAAVGTPEHRSVIATLEASPALSAYERELHHESVRQLSDALADALREESGAVAPVAGSVAAPDPVASLTAAVWMAAIRALLIEHRAHLAATGADAATRAAVEQFAERVLSHFQGMATGPAASRASAAVTGWPDAVRRAG
jgi:AcrR family transcriptional regulator